ncbi:MAG: SusD/RagB family nutrient-binding outer membrane lipoprotein [Balneolaceae bacterium]
MDFIKKRILTSITGCLVVLLLFATACEDFETVNSNPNEPEEVDPNLLFPSVIKKSVDNSVDNSMYVGNIVAQHTSKVLFGSTDRYDWDSFTGYWNGFYGALRDANDMYNVGVEQEHENYQGVALVMKTWMFSMLTDAYGDIPYTEALEAKSENENSPAYDEQADIYAGMLEDLETANELLDPDGEPIENDILYDNDILKWKKFANSLRLRLLMRISHKQDVSGDMQQIVDNPDTHPVFETVNDNAALEYESSNPNQFPIHTYRVGTFQEFRASKTLVDTLNIFNDPRLPVFADPTDNSVEEGDPEYVGVPNGLEDDAAANYNGSPSDQSRMGSRYFDEPNEAKGLIMSLAELKFILAEAAERGLIDGDTETYYEEGIEASFEQYDVEPDDGYFSQPDVAFDPNRALEQIGTQKWISLFFTGLEAWFDWRRTGYPELEPSVENRNSDQIPVRMRYPTEEQSLNSENYQEAVDRQGPDNINTEMWIVEE